MISDWERITLEKMFFLSTHGREGNQLDLQRRTTIHEDPHGLRLGIRLASDGCAWKRRLKKIIFRPEDGRHLCKKLFGGDAAVSDQDQRISAGCEKSSATPRRRSEQNHREKSGKEQ